MTPTRRPSSPSPAPAPAARRPAAFTLIELLLALSIVAILSAAVFTALAGALQTSEYINNASATNSQVDIVVARMMHNLRYCSALTSPTNNTAQSTFTIITQQDPNNSNATYTVIYTLTGSTLTENDTRYGTNTLCTNVSTFTAQLITGTTNVVQITLTVGSASVGSVTRTFKVYCRNL